MQLFRDTGTPQWQQWGVMGGPGNAVYTAPETGSYGLLIQNQNGGTGAYTYSVNQCQPVPDKFTQHSPNKTVSWPGGRFSFIQEDLGWAGVGVRGPEDWEITLYEHASGGDPGFCFSNPLATSTSAGAGEVDFVIGDFNRNALNEYYPYVELPIGPGDGWISVSRSAFTIHANGPPYGSGLSSSDVLDVLEVFLVTGNEYHFDFLPGSTGDVKMLLFEPGGDTYWASRSDRVLETSTAADYTPGTTGLYGIAVVNDAESSGSYQISVTSATISAPTEPVMTGSAIRALVPNPTDGRLSIRFRVAKPGAFGFEIVDVGGRLVSRLGRQQWESGTWETGWNGRTRSGEPAPSGVYFVRMYDGDHVRDVRKFVISH
jgi:hypothetical protein